MIPFKFDIIELKLMNEDEGKEGRYFPTESEISTLAKYIQIYFSHPERSLQRSQVVQQVSAILTPQNPHWDQRKIRLWFNNNKKIYYKGLSDHEVVTPKDPTRIQFSPAKKIYTPPRPLSASQFSSEDYMVDRAYSTPGSPPTLDQSQIQIQNQEYALAEQYKISRPDPKQGTFAFQLLVERSLISQNPMDPLTSQTYAEQHLSSCISNLYDNYWSHSLASNFQIPIISDPNSLPATPDKQETPNLLSIVNLVPYDYIESSDGHDLVAYSLQNDQRMFFYSNPESEFSLDKFSSKLDFYPPVLSMVRDPHSPFTWLHCASHLIRVPHEPNPVLPEMTIFNSQILTEGHRSALTIWNDQLVLGCGAHVNSYYIQPDEDFHLILGLNLFHQSLSTITSLCSITNNLLAVASCEHHAIHVYASNGALSSCNVYHSAGITSLGQYSNEKTFLSGGAEGMGLLWDLRTAFPVQSFIKHFGPITAISSCIDQDLQIVATGGVDGFVKAWDIRAGRCLGSVDLGDTAVSSLIFECDEDNNKFITAVTSDVIKNQYYGLWVMNKDLCQKHETDISPNAEVLIQIQ